MILYSNRAGHVGAIDESFIAGYKIEELSSDWIDVYIILKEGNRIHAYGFSYPKFVNRACGESRTIFCKAYMESLLEYLGHKFPANKNLFGDGKQMPGILGNAMEMCGYRGG